MPTIQKPGRLLLTAALAASTTLTGPTFALAGQPAAMRIAQADDGSVAPGTDTGDAPIKPRRQAQPEAGASGGAEAGQTRQRQQKRGAQSETGEAGDVEGGQSSRRQRSSAQGAAQSSESGTATPDAEQPSSRRQRRQAAEPNDAETGETAQPRAPSSGTAAEGEQPTTPSRRDKRQPAATEDAGSAASSSSDTDGQTPRRDRKNRQQQSESAPASSEEPAASGTPDDGSNEKPSARRQRTEQPSEAPATTAQPGTQPAAGRNGSNRRQQEQNQARGATTAPAAPAGAAPAAPSGAASSAAGKAPAGGSTPNAEAPAAGSGLGTTSSEVPAAPRQRRGTTTNAPATAGTPEPAQAAPDATTIPATPGTGATPPAGTAPSDATTAGQTAPGTPGQRQPSANGQALPGQAAPNAAETPTPAANGTGQAATGTAGAPAAAVGLRPQPVPADVQNAPVQPGRIDQSDARVQTLQQPVAVQPITQERGQRIQEAPRYELPPDAKVVKRDGDRQILSLGAAAAAGAVAGAAAGYFIRSNDDDRLGTDSRDRYTERLPRGRSRETIVRDNGVQVVTITNRYGDVVQRSRVLPDGHEVVLFYDPDSADNRRPDYYDDPGRDLPPVKVDIPEDEYIVDTDRPDEDLYYDTLAAPPVETVDRVYSIDEVRRSTRIRDKVRRIDLATINFDFASANVPQDQVDKLQALAEAIDKVVKANPGETFLIEGHTDAVGSPEANLVLSDKRAESVASALTQYFDVPAENLVTQGYGEQELKVDTQSENRENRRVTVRRITALVKPVETSGR